MPDATLHIRIKKGCAAILIEDVIEVQAVEAVEEEDAVELTVLQKQALDKELAAIATNPVNLQK